MKKILSILAILAGVGAFAQNSRPSDDHQLTLEAAAQQFDASNNAAGMGLSQPSSGSKTELKGFYEAGDFHPVQQGDSDLGFRFSTLRYDSFSDKLFMKGSFYYSFDREAGRPWSDVRDPWFSIPFIYGSSVAKNYDTHDCGLSFDLYTAPLADWISVGVRSSYRVSDISGMRDPRPRTGYLDYQLVPSVLLSFGRHSLGFDAGYGYSKEKLSGLSTIQSYPNLYYYKMSGLDHVDGAIAAYSGFKRQFAGSRVLGDLSYGYGGETVKLMVSGGMEYGKLNAYGDKMQSPGSYNYFTYNGVADLLLYGENLLHRLHFKGQYKDAGADEYLQELESVKDPETGATTETWVTLYEYTNRYMLKTVEAGLDYTLYGACSGSDYGWSAGVEALWSDFRKDCYLPHSEFGASGLTLELGGSVLLLNSHNHKLELAANAGGRIHVNCFQNLQYDNLYTQEVLVKDLSYYSSDYVSANASLTWTFPLNLGKAGWANGYLKLCGGTLSARPSASLSKVSLSVGLFTF